MTWEELVGTLDKLGKRITSGKFNLEKSKLNPKLELSTKFNLGSVWSSPKSTNFKWKNSFREPFSEPYVETSYSLTW